MIPLVNLLNDAAPYQEEIENAILEVYRSGQYIMGPEVGKFEEELAEWNGARYARGVSSGTDALYLALTAAGIGEGDEVITTPFTFFATVEAVIRTGATPVLVDISDEDYNIDPAAVEAAVTSSTRAIIPVHLYGCPCRMDRILELARDRNVLVIEDFAQAIGAEYDGRKAGGLGDIGCTSFFPAKNLGGIGDGGAVVTDSGDMASRVAALRQHGSEEKYLHKYLGVNARLDSIQAAVLRIKLRHISEWNDSRRRIASVYGEQFRDLPIKLQKVPEKGKHVYNQFTIRTDRRDELKDHLARKGIPTAIHYPLPLHRQPALEYLGYKEGSFPVSETASREVLSLPIYPSMPDSDLEQVIASVRAFFGE